MLRADTMCTTHTHACPEQGGMANILRTYYSQKVTLVLHPSESEHELIAGMAVGWALPGFMCIIHSAGPYLQF